MVGFWMRIHDQRHFGRVNNEGSIIPLCHPSILVWPLVVASVFFFFFSPKFLQNAKNKNKKEIFCYNIPFLLKKSPNFGI